MVIFLKYEAVIGLETHVQLDTKTKMFSASSNSYQSAEPNTLVDPVTLALPGTLPVVNKRAVEDAITIGLALNCSIREITKFDRKQYTYPDLMKGYQISQFDQPICFDGYLDLPNNPTTRVRINRVHMEEDVAKLIHVEGPKGDPLHTLIDVNRSGVPLMEIVTEPDMRSTEEVELYISSLQKIIRYLGVGTANMEEASFRCDANISVRIKGEERLTTKVEIKNMNRIKAVTRAVEYEIKRQINEIESGGKIIQETRGWNDNKGITVSQRSKEDANDYRYFPEPDIPPLKIEKSLIKKIKLNLPELPIEKKRRFIDELNLSEYDSDLLTSSKNISIFFEKVIKYSNNKNEPYIKKISKEAANWINGEIFRYINDNKITDISVIPVSAKNLSILITKIIDNEINKNSAKKIFEIMWEKKQSPKEIIEQLNLVMVTDNKQLLNIVDDVIKNNPNAVEDYKNGKDNALKFLMGQLMKLTKGQADPKQSIELIRSKLDE